MADAPVPYSPLPPPRAPLGVGPDAWWNPLSPSWPPNKLGKAAGDALRNRLATKEEELQQAIADATAAAKAAGQSILPDPITVAVAVVGEPSWGYYVPTVGLGLLSLGVIAGVGGLVYRARKKKR